MKTTSKVRRGKALNRTAIALTITVLMMATILSLSAVTTTGNRNQQPAATTTATAVTTGNQQPETTRAPPPTPTPIKEWSYTAGGYIHSSPCVADVDGDTLQEVLVGSNDWKVYCLSRTGGVEWSYNTGGSVFSSPCVADLDGDSQLEVLVSSMNGKVCCLSRTGGLEWSYSTGGMVYSSPCVADLDGDSQQEVLVGSNDRKVYCLNKTGGLEWSYTTGNSVESSPCVADLDGDSQQEVLVGSNDGKVYCLNKTGGLEWSYITGNIGRSSPCVADVDGDSQQEVLVGSHDIRVYCLSSTGGLEWSYITGNIIESSPCVADVDGDSALEVLVCSWDHKVYCLSRTGGLEWSYNTGSLSSSPCVADVDGDAQLEVLVGSQDNKVYCLSRTGGVEWTYTTGFYVESSPCVADVDGDSQLEVLVGSDDNKVYCLSVVGAPYNLRAYPWPSIGFRGDMLHSGVYVDTDKDNLTDTYEGIVGTTYNAVDTDGDTATDYWEFTHSTNPFVDTVPPATITNLATGSPTGNSITLAWTAPGDNVATGTARGYVVKYSTTGTINTANWNSATEYVQSWTPKAAGQGESYAVTGLAYDTTYWFAVEAYDETPNCGAVSNSPSRKTTDTTSPGAITDLAVIGVVDNNVTLSWTAPGDNGASGTATSYLVRYSTSGPITDGNWASATSYTQSWAPRSGGSSEVHTITGLNHDAAYWFAIRAQDEVPQQGATSNSPSATISDNTSPGTITLSAGNPTGNSIDLSWIATGDNGASGTATGYMLKYSTDGSITEATWNSATEYVQSWVPQTAGQLEMYTVTGFDSDSTYWFAIKAYDEVPHYGDISNSPSARTTDTTSPEAITDLTGIGSTQNSVTLAWTAPGDNGISGTATSYAVKYSTSGPIDDANWASATPYTQLWAPRIGGSAEVHTITGLSDDAAYWFAIKACDEVSQWGGCSNSPSATTSDTTSPGTITLYVMNPTANSIDLSWIATGDNGASGTATGYLLKYSTSGPVTDATWDSATTYVQSLTWTPKASGQTESYTVTGFASDSTYWFAIKAFDEVPHYGVISNSPSAGTTDSTPPGKITDLAVIGVVDNNVTLSWTAPGDNGASGTATSYVVKYSTSGPITESNWVSAIAYTQSWVPRSGGSAEVHTIMGLDHDTTYWFAIKASDEVAQQGDVSNSPSVTICDNIAPQMIVDLVAWNATGNSITLNWTAPGENGAYGTATGYVVKYSTNGPITDANWGSATTYVQSWSPLTAGGDECQVISGLASDTRYWFVVEAYDEVPSYGGISNSPSAMTTDIIAPRAITDLAVVIKESDSITLSWTAPGDNWGNGTAAGYVVKYSTNGPITDANWGSATTFTQSWTPRSGGNAELYTITGLSSNTTHWFAIKTVDEVPITGGVSNSPSGRTTAPPSTSTGGEELGSAGASQAIALAGVGVGAVGVLLAVLALVFANRRGKTRKSGRGA